MSKAKSTVCCSISTGPQSFLWASTGLSHVWCPKALKMGQDYRMWLVVWGPVLHGHLSEWEIFFSLWRWERSWQCPVLSLKIVTWAALSSWWMLSSSVPMSRCCCHSVLELLQSMAFASLQDMGCADCSSLLTICDSRSASSLPPTPQWEGIHRRVTDVLFLSRDSCLMLLKIWYPPGDWRLCRMDRQSVKNTVLVGSLSTWFSVWAVASKT